VDDEVSIVSRGALLVLPIFDDKDRMPLVFEEVDNTEEPDWFKGVMCGNEESAVTEPHKRDWFFEANKGEEKSDDELGNSSDILVEGFGSEAPGGVGILQNSGEASRLADKENNKVTLLLDTLCFVIRYFLYISLATNRADPY